MILSKNFSRSSVVSSFLVFQMLLSSSGPLTYAQEGKLCSLKDANGEFTGVSGVYTYDSQANEWKCVGGTVSPGNAQGTDGAEASSGGWGDSLLFWPGVVLGIVFVVGGGIALRNHKNHPGDGWGSAVKAVPSVVGSAAVSSAVYVKSRLPTIRFMSNPFRKSPPAIFSQIGRGTREGAFKLVLNSASAQGAPTVTYTLTRVVSGAISAGVQEQMDGIVGSSAIFGYVASGASSSSAVSSSASSSSGSAVVEQKVDYAVDALFLSALAGRVDGTLMSIFLEKIWVPGNKGKVFQAGVEKSLADLDADAANVPPRLREAYILLVARALDLSAQLNEAGQQQAVDVFANAMRIAAQIDDEGHQAVYALMREVLRGALQGVDEDARVLALFAKIEARFKEFIEKQEVALLALDLPRVDLLSAALPLDVLYLLKRVFSDVVQLAVAYFQPKEYDQYEIAKKGVTVLPIQALARAKVLLEGEAEPALESNTRLAAKAAAALEAEPHSLAVPSVAQSGSALGGAAPAAPVVDANSASVSSSTPVTTPVATLSYMRRAWNVALDVGSAIVNKCRNPWRKNKVSDSSSSTLEAEPHSLAVPSVAQSGSALGGAAPAAPVVDAGSVSSPTPATPVATLSYMRQAWNIALGVGSAIVNKCRNPWRKNKVSDSSSSNVKATADEEKTSEEGPVVAALGSGGSGVGGSAQPATVAQKPGTGTTANLPVNPAPSAPILPNSFSAMSLSALGSVGRRVVVPALSQAQKEEMDQNRANAFLLARAQSKAGLTVQTQSAPQPDSDIEVDPALSPPIHGPSDQAVAAFLAEGNTPPSSD